MQLHAVSNTRISGKYTGYFTCKACEFIGPLEDAIKHSVSNQFLVEYKPIKPKISWTKNNEIDSGNPYMGRTKNTKQQRRFMGTKRDF